MIDYDRWRRPLIDHGSVAEALVCGIRRDGIHRVRIDGGTIDLLTQRLCRIKDGDTDRPVLVCFNGAVTNRDVTAGPYFAGLGVAEALNLPLVSIADPVMTEHEDLGIAWYAGSARMPALAQEIAGLLNALALQDNYRLILFGGSGGGFATLNVLSRLTCRKTGFVWNPQTSIGAYDPPHVDSYLTSAFGLTFGNAPAVTELSAALDRTGIVHDVTAVTFGEGELLYIQNRSDWHIRAHTRPFTQSGTWQRRSRRVAASADRQTTLWFGEWGSGHVPPSGELVQRVLRALADGQSPEQVALALDADDPGGREIRWMGLDGDATATLEVKRRSGQCHVRATVQSAGDGLSYCFHLKEGTASLAKRPFDPDPTTSFDIPETCTAPHIVGYIKDELGTTVVVKADIPA